MKIKTTSKLKRPEVTIREDGSKVYAGSLSNLAGAVLSEAQERQILIQLREPRHISSIVVSDVSPFNPFAVEAVRRYVGQLSQDGMAVLVKGEDGKKMAGWKLTEQGEKLIKGDDE